MFIIIIIIIIIIMVLLWTVADPQPGLLYAGQT